MKSESTAETERDLQAVRCGVHGDTSGRRVGEVSTASHRGRRRERGAPPPHMRRTEGQPRIRMGHPADKGAPLLMQLDVPPSLDPTILLLGVIQETWNVSSKGPRSNAHSGFVRGTKN